MGLMAALHTATSGLRATQAGMSLVAENVANAGSAGYVRRSLTPVEVVAGGSGSGVRTGDVQRLLDVAAQRQMRLEGSGAAYTGLSAAFASRLDQLFGRPGGAGSLDGAMNGFTTALQALAADPASSTTRSAVLDRAAALAGRLQGLSGDVQGLRTDAEARLGSAVERADALLAGIAAANGRIVAASGGAGAPALLDERDRMIDELSTLMDVQATPGPNGSVSLATSGGLTLVNGTAATRLTFDGRGTLTPEAATDADPARRGVGTITATFPGGTSVDAVAGGLIRSGEIAAALDLRDRVLPQAQARLDELAAGLARALGDRPDLVTPASVPGSTGFTLDLSGLASGNLVTLDHQDTSTSSPGPVQRILVVPTNGVAPVTTPRAELSDPSARVIRVDVSGGLGAAMTSLQGQLASEGLTATASGSTLTVTGASGSRAVTGAGITVAALSSGQVQLPFFVDGGRGNAPYVGGAGGSSQLAGFAARIAVNPALVADRSRLVAVTPATPSGDAARAQHLLDALTTAERGFPEATGIGGAGGFTGSVSEFARRVVEREGADAEAASRLHEGQQVALATAQGRFDETAAVNIDGEMAQLLQLQTAYGANARVLTAVREMLDLLMRI